MSPRSLKPLTEYVRELADTYLKAEVERQAKEREQPDYLPIVTVPRRVPWPLEDWGDISRRAAFERPDPDPETTKTMLQDRLQKVLYPQPQGNKRGKTFFNHLQENGLENILFTPDVFWEIRLAWSLGEYERIERDFRRTGLSGHGIPAKFHLAVMTRLFAHLKELRKLAHEYAVPDVWLANYFAALQKQLLVDAAAYWPRLSEGFIRASRLREYSIRLSLQCEIFSAITKALHRQHKRNKKLALQLTALACSSLNSVCTGKLDVSPDSVKQNVKKLQIQLPVHRRVGKNLRQKRH